MDYLMPVLIPIICLVLPIGIGLILLSFIEPKM